MADHSARLTLSPEQRRLMLEQLEDLRHDLGKHVRLPVGLLPPGAAPEQVREALAAGLLRTRRAQGRVVSARQLWEEFAAQSEPLLRNARGWLPLAEAVAAALLWESSCDPDAPPPDAPALRRDLAAITPAIDRLIEELELD